MSSAYRRFTGSSLSNYWRARGWLVTKPRPAVVKSLGVVLSAMGLFLIAQGIISAWFMSSVLPGPFELSLSPSLQPGSGVGQQLAGALLILCGVAAAAGGIGIARTGRGIRLTLLLSLVTLVTGSVLVSAGMSPSAPYLLWAGIFDILFGASALMLMALGWYTLDPLGLHW